MLSDAEWARVAAAVMDRTGLARQGDEFGVRWVAVRHAPDHIHTVATLARQDGIRAKTWNDFYRVRDACHEAERWFGLRATAPADRTAARRPTRAEAEQAARRGWAEPPRTVLRRKVAAAAGGASTEHEFFARLDQAGVLVRRRYSSIDPGQVTGYAVSLPRHTGKDGGVRDQSKAQAVVLGNLAIAHIRQGSRDAAVATLHRAVDVTEQNRGGGGMNVVFGTGRELRRWRGSAAVQDVYDRIMALMAA